MEKEKDGVWRTIRGRRIFIGKGESLGEAMAKSGKFNRSDIRESKNDVSIKDRLERRDKHNFSNEKNTKEYHKMVKKDYNSLPSQVERQDQKNRIYPTFSQNNGYTAGNTRIERNYNRYSDMDKRELRHENLQKKLADYKAKKQSNNKIDNAKEKFYERMDKYSGNEEWDGEEEVRKFAKETGMSYEQADKELRQDYRKYEDSKQSNNKVNSSKMNDKDVEKEVAMSTFRMFGAKEVNYNGEKIRLDNNITNEQSNGKKWEVKSTGGFGQQYGEGNIPIRDGKVDYESHFGAFAQDLTLLSDKELKTALETQQKMFDKYSSRPKNYDARTRNGRALKIMQDSELTNAKLSVEALKKETIRRENEKHPQYKGTEYEVKYHSLADAINDKNSKINQYIAKKKSNKK